MCIIVSVMLEMQSREATDKSRARAVSAAPVPPEKPRSPKVELRPESLDARAEVALAELIKSDQLTWYGELKAGATPVGSMDQTLLARAGELHRQRLGLPDIGAFGSKERATFQQQEEERKYYTSHGWIDWDGKLTAKGREFAGDNAAEVMVLQRCRSKVPNMDFSTYAEGAAYERSVDPAAQQEYDKYAAREIVQERRRSRPVSQEAFAAKGEPASKKSLFARLGDWMKNW